MASAVGYGEQTFLVVGSEKVQSLERVCEFMDLITLSLQDFAKYTNYVWLIIYKNYQVIISSECSICYKVCQRTSISIESSALSFSLY
jgi:hypothetical protein